MNKAFQCPQCGSPAPERLHYSKLMVCDYCGSSLLLEDEAIKTIGKQSVIADYPSLFRIGGHYRYRHTTFTMLGRVQYDYGAGYWDEWWIIDENGDGKWLSVDEGDIAIEQPIDVGEVLPDYDALKIGQSISIAQQSLRVSEKNRGVCHALAGQLPEIIRVGDRHRYVHCSGSDHALVTLEYHDDTVFTYQGRWLDPFDIKALSDG